MNESERTLVQDADGNLVGVQVPLEEVVKSRAVEETTKRERLLLHTLMDHLPDVIFVKDPAGRFLMANPALLKLYGATTADELIGKTDYDFVPAEVAAHFAQDDRQVMASATPLIDREESNVDTDGHVLWLLTSKIPLCGPDGKIIGLVGIARNITRQKVAEQHARRQAMEAGLLHQSTALARETDSLETLLKGIIGIVCRLTPWSLGHAYLPRETDGALALVPTGIWNSEPSSSSVAATRTVTEARFVHPSRANAGSTVTDMVGATVSDATTRAVDVTERVTPLAAVTLSVTVYVPGLAHLC